MKNYEPLVLGPALAIESNPTWLCLIKKFSSLNFSPKIDFPPVPLWLVKSPPYSIKLGIILWNPQPLYPYPFYPVQSYLKFLLVLGTTLSNRLKVIRPDFNPLIVISKKH